MIGLNRLKRAIGDVPTGGMQTGDPKVRLKLCDAQRLEVEFNTIVAERDTLKQQNAELAAQVELLREAYKELSGAINDLDDCESETEEFEQASANVFAVMQYGYNNALRKSPAQCLLEVRAEAVERAIELYTHKLGTDEKLNNVGFDIIRRFGEYIHPGGLRDYVQQLRSGDCDQYANKIRGGE